MRSWPVLVLFSALLAAAPRGAAAADAGDGGTNDGASGDAAGDDGSAGNDDASSDDGSANEGGATLACDGALCDTTNGSACAVAGSTIGRCPIDSTSLTFLLSAAAWCGARRFRRGARRPASEAAAG